MNATNKTVPEKLILRRGRKVEQVSLFLYRFQILLNFNIDSSLLDELITTNKITAVSYDSIDTKWPLYQTDQVIESILKASEEKKSQYSEPLNHSLNG